MANICKNTINVVGVKQSSEAFTKALSKSTFALDLDDLDPKLWGVPDNVDGKTWYQTLVAEYAAEGSYAARYQILYPTKPIETFGVAVPSYYVETQSEPPVRQFIQASKDFPELTFHLAWWILQDGPVGEVVAKDGKVLEEFQRNGSWYLFDWPVIYPNLNLLTAHLDLTLAQRAAARVQDAVETLDGLRRILDDRRFIDSPFHEYRDGRKLSVTKRTLHGLLAKIREAAKELTFRGVFLEEAEAAQRAAAREHQDGAEL